MRVRRNKQAGFTLLEVLIAVAIIAIGLVAMMAMQVAFVNGSTMARDMSTATQLGQWVVEDLKAESMMWNNLGGNLTATNTPNLFAGVQGNRGQYMRMYNGMPMNPDGMVRDTSLLGGSALLAGRAKVNAKFCVDVRMDFMANSNNEVIIGQVRVVWPSDNRTATWVGTPTPVPCETAGVGLNNIVYIGGNPDLPNPDVNVVHVPFSVRRHSM